VTETRASELAVISADLRRRGFPGLADYINETEREITALHVKLDEVRAWANYGVGLPGFRQGDDYAGAQADVREILDGAPSDG